jgi:hypothetical protein
VATTLLASSAQVTGFSYAGPKTVSTRAGQIAALEFTASSATFTALDLQMPCAAHAWLELSQPAASSTGTSGQLTLDAVSFEATVNGGAVSYSPATPPSAQPLPSGSGTMTGVRIVTVSAAAAQLVLNAVASETHSC